MDPLLAAHEAAATADSTEAAAFADFFDAAPKPVRMALGLRVERVADATLFIAPGYNNSLLNRAIGLGTQREAQTSDVDAITNIYQAAGSPIWTLHWNPFARPSHLLPELHARGFVQARQPASVKMMRAAYPAPSVQTDLRVQVAASGQIDDVARVFTEAFVLPPVMGDWLRALGDRPGWTVYAATDGDAVVGCGCRHQVGESAWLGMGAVHGSHRRRGGQGALMALRIADAVAAGARRIFIETGKPGTGESSPSLNNMKRCGFVPVATRLNLNGPVLQR